MKSPYDGFLEACERAGHLKTDVRGAVEKVRLAAEITLAALEVGAQGGPGKITPEELVVLNKLGEAAKLFLALPEDRNDIRREFAATIHRAQDMIAFRVARRANPEIWV